MDIELTGPLPAVTGDGMYQWLWVLGRLHGEPLGTCLIPVGEAGLTADQLGARLWRDLHGPVTSRFAEAGQPGPAGLTARGLKADPDTWPFLRRRSQVLAAAPFISVVVCTRDRPEALETCLSRLRSQRYPRFEVVVVENVPAGGAVRALVADRLDGIGHQYVQERRPGLSWARNTGVAAALGEIVAFLDDDDEPDESWLAGLAGGFAREDRVGCVTGLILPARLDTPAEHLFEQLGGHRKGRGFTSDIFTHPGRQSALFPLPPFGAGANMAFRREVLAAIGGFDVALGAGTPSFACEDTLAFTLALLAGHAIAYEPAALMWHHHRRDMAGLRHQMHGYSIGLTAFYAALLRHRPSVLPELLRLLPAASSYLRNSSEGSQVTSPGLLAELDRRHRSGLLKGPLAYVRSTRAQPGAGGFRRRIGTRSE